MGRQGQNPSETRSDSEGCADDTKYVLTSYTHLLYSPLSTVSSVNVKHVFKRGRDTISYKRHSLSDKTVRASLAFGDWVKYPGLVPSDLLSLLTEENKRRVEARLTPEKAIAAIDGDSLDDLLQTFATASTLAVSVIGEDDEEDGSSDEEEGGEGDAGDANDLDKDVV